MNKIFLLLICSLFLSASSFGDESQTKNCNYLLSTFNAFKFIHDHRFLPDARAEENKLLRMTEFVLALNDGKGPDLLGLVEVDGAFLQQLVDHPHTRHLKLLNHGVADKPDDRGNNLGLISRFPLTQPPVVHTYWDEKADIWNFRRGFGRDEFKDGYLTRPIMEYRLMLPNGEELIVFVNHWPSKKLRDWSALQRMEAAEYLKKQTDQILDQNPDSNILIMGDFNATPYGPEIRAGLGLASSKRLIHLEDLAFDIDRAIKDFKKQNPKVKREVLEDFVKELLRKRGSYYYYKEDRWDLFDQLIISNNMKKYLLVESIGPMPNPRFMDRDGHPMSFFPKSGKGLSDHIPIGALFNFSR